MLENSLAKSITAVMIKHSGVYVPPTLITGIPIFYAADNIDFNEDTPDGKRTLHGTVPVAFQTPQLMGNIPLVNEVSDTLHIDIVHNNEIETELRSLKGSVKPKESQKFVDFEVDKFKDSINEYQLFDNV